MKNVFYFYLKTEGTFLPTQYTILRSDFDDGGSYPCKGQRGIWNLCTSLSIKKCKGYNFDITLKEIYQGKCMY